MRCRVAGLGLLATPARLPHGVINPAARWPQSLQISPSSARLDPRLYLGIDNGAGASRASAPDGGTERSEGSHRRRRGIGSCSTKAVRLGAVRPRTCSAAPTPDGIKPQLKHSSTATILELHCRSEDDSILAVYGKLHRLLGNTYSRQLLGPDAVATLTSLNFLVLHHRDGGPSLWDGLAEDGGDVGGARLAVGDRSWDICGMGPWVSS